MAYAGNAAAVIATRDTSFPPIAQFVKLSRPRRHPLTDMATASTPAPAPSLPIAGLAAQLGALAQAPAGPAWEEVTRLALPWMHRVSHGLLRDASLADDAVQEALLALRAHAGAFHARPGAGVNPDEQALRWIVRLTANCARMVRRGEQRAQRRGRSGTAPSVVEAPPEVSLDPSAAEAVQAAVDELPERERAAVVLHIVAHLPYEQVAQELRCPVGSAKSWVHRGLHRLRRRLRARGLTEAMLLAVLQAPPSPLPVAPAPSAVPLARLGSGAAPAHLLPLTLAGGLMAHLPVVLATAAALLAGVGATVHLRAQDAAPLPPVAADGGHGTPAVADPAAALRNILGQTLYASFTDASLGDIADFLTHAAGVPIRVDAVHPSPVTLAVKSATVGNVLDLVAALSDTAQVGVSPVRFITPDAAALARRLEAPCTLSLPHATWSDAVLALWAADVPVVDCAPPAAEAWQVDLPPSPGATLRAALDHLCRAHGQHWTAVGGRILLGDGAIGRTSAATLTKMRTQLAQEVHVEFDATNPTDIGAFLNKVSGLAVVVDRSLQMPVTLHGDHLPLGNLLTMFAKLEGAEPEIRSGAVVIAPLGTSLRPSANPTGLIASAPPSGHAAPPPVAPAAPAATAPGPRSF